jgi:hypothetical protein
MMRDAHNRIASCMAKLSELVVRTSEVTGIPEATVREVSRRLREEGLIHTGKGGRYGGADMTPKDAASLLTGLMIVKVSSPPFAGIASLTKDYLNVLKSHDARGHRSVPARWDRRLELSELCKLKSGHTFGDAFTALIASLSNGEFERKVPKWGWIDLGIEVFSPWPARINGPPEPNAQINFLTEAFGQSGLSYFRPRIAKRIDTCPPSKWSDMTKDFIFDLSVGARIRYATLTSVGLLLRNPETADG